MYVCVCVCVCVFTTTLKLEKIVHFPTDCVHVFYMVFTLDGII